MNITIDINFILPETKIGVVDGIPLRMKDAVVVAPYENPPKRTPLSLWQHCRTKKHVKTLVIEKLSKEKDVQEALNMTPDEALVHIADEKENVVSYTAKTILRKLNKKEALSYENDR